MLHSVVGPADSFTRTNESGEVAQNETVSERRDAIILNFGYIHSELLTVNLVMILHNLDRMVGIKFWQESFAHHFFSTSLLAL
jgi:hypothetical protein